MNFIGELHVLNFVVCNIQLYIVLLTIVFIRIQGNREQLTKFLHLTIIYILYNLSGGFFFDENLPYHTLQRILVDLGGTSVCVYVYYYFVSVYKINPFHISGKLFIAGIMVCFTAILVIPQFFTENYNFSLRNSYLYLTSMVGVYLIFMLGRFLFFQKEKRTAEWQGYLITFICASLPIQTLLGDHQVRELIIMNSAYFLLAYMFVQYSNIKVIQDFMRKNKDSEVKVDFEFLNEKYEQLSPKRQELLKIAVKNGFDVTTVTDLMKYNERSYYRNIKFICDSFEIYDKKHEKLSLFVNHLLLVHENEKTVKRQ